MVEYLFFKKKRKIRSCWFWVKNCDYLVIIIIIVIIVNIFNIIEKVKNF